MRRTLIVPRGLPGAGKTTRAELWVAEDPERRVRVGTDEIALMLHSHLLTGDDLGYGIQHAEREQLVVNAAIEVLLRSGLDVVCDGPFLLPRYLTAIRELADRCDADLEVWDMTDVAIEECIRRDRDRGLAGGRSVGERQIRFQYEQYRRHQSPRTVDSARHAGPERPQGRSGPPDQRTADRYVSRTAASASSATADK